MRPAPERDRVRWPSTTWSTMPRTSRLLRPDAVEPAIPEASEPASDPGVAVMDPEAAGRPGEMPLPVDPLQVPEEEQVGAAASPTTDKEATEANGQPTGAFRFFRALVPWSTASDVQHAKDREARRS